MLEHIEKGNVDFTYFNNIAQIGSSAVLGGDNCRMNPYSGCVVLYLENALHYNFSVLIHCLRLKCVALPASVTLKNV